MRIVDQIVHQRRHIFHRQRLQLIGAQTEDGQSRDAGEHAAIERVQMIVAQIQDAQIVQAIEGALGQQLCVCQRESVNFLQNSCNETRFIMSHFGCDARTPIKPYERRRHTFD